MVATLLVLSLCFVSLNRVDASCFSCPYNSVKEDCTDPFIPPVNVPETDVCFFNDEINTKLCRRYKNGYQIRCQTGGSALSCQKQSTNLCPRTAPAKDSSSAIHHVTPKLVIGSRTAQTKFPNSAFHPFAPSLVLIPSLAFISMIASL